MARWTPRRKNQRSSRIWDCTIRRPTSLPRRVSCTSGTGCGSSSMPAPRRRASFLPSERTPEAPLDLSFSVLRSVSPIHLEYMANMGVRARMSISLIVRDRLWGLISCLNHTRPWRVSHEMRAACEFLGRLTSLQIAALEDRELLALRASRRATEEALADAMRESTDAEAARGSVRPPGGADGAGRRRGGRVGERRGTDDVRPHAAARAHPGDRCVGREKERASGRSPPTSLGALFPRAREASDVASGLLTFALPGAPQRRLLWFRPEIIKTVSWGGDPTKPVAAESGERLRPRHSFAAWTRGGEAPLASVDGERPRGCRRAAAARHRGRPRAAARERATCGAGAGRPDRRRVPRPQEPAVGHPVASRGDVEPSVCRRRGRTARCVWARIASGRSANHMKAMIDDLLDLAKIEAQRFALNLQSVESRRHDRGGAAIAAPLAEAKRITLAARVDRYTEAGSRPRADLPRALEPRSAMRSSSAPKGARLRSARSAAAASC